MNLLLDTHILLWWLAADRLLPASAAAAIADERNASIVSAAAIWEASIKAAIGRLDIADDLPDAVSAEGFDLLSVTAVEAWAAGSLPRHHNDPFDRMLVAQARARDLTLVSVDPVFRDYEVERLPF